MIENSAPRTGPRDPRAVANLLLDLADERGIEIKHIKLQKLLYFAHCMTLLRTGAPLVSGFFEAWKRGPVHPAVYRAFRDAGATAIKARALREDVLTGERDVVPPSNDPIAYDAVSAVLLGLGNMRDFDLVELSHAPGGPWDNTVDAMERGLALGARIDNSLIRAHFHRHKLVIRAHSEADSAAADGGKIGDAIVVEKPFSSTDRDSEPLRKKVR